MTLLLKVSENHPTFDLGGILMPFKNKLKAEEWRLAWRIKNKEKLRQQRLAWEINNQDKLKAYSMKRNKK